MFYVYIYYNPESGKPFYIGKGTGARYLKHLSETKENTENYKKWALIQGLRNKGLEPIIKKVFETDNEELAYLEETRLIKLYGRKDIDQNGILANICEDNRPPKRSKPLTDEHKKKISTALKGHEKYNPHYQHSEETKKKIGLANKGKGSSMKGKTHLEETKRKIRETNKAKMTEERKKQISELHKGRIFTEEHKAKLKESRARQVISEETKRKMKESQIKRWENRKNNNE